MTTVKADIMALFAQRLAKKEEEHRKRESLFMELDSSSGVVASGGAALNFKATVAAKAKEVVFDFD